MEQFAALTDLGASIANALALLISLVFIIGAPAIMEQGRKRAFWLVFFSLGLIDLILVIKLQTIEKHRIDYMAPHFEPASALKLLFLYLKSYLFRMMSIVVLLHLALSYYPKIKIDTQRVLYAFVIPCALALIISLGAFAVDQKGNFSTPIEECIYTVRSIVFLLTFCLIGWSTRLQSITSSLVFVSYGMLQCAYFFEQFAKDPEVYYGKRLELILLIKFSLIVAIYKSLGIKEQE